MLYRLARATGCFALHLRDATSGFRRSIGLATFLLALNPGFAAAQTPDAPLISWGSELTVASVYVWRGDVELGTANAQPSTWVGVGPFTVTSWMAITRSRLHEHDTAIEYSHELGALTVRGGWTNYFVPAGNEGRFTNDVMAGVEYRWRITPSLSAWRSVGGPLDRYVEAAAVARLPHRHLTFEPRIAVGHRTQPAADDASTHLETSLTLEWNAGMVVFRPFISNIVRRTSSMPGHVVGGLQVNLH